jgi:hypothetical protein
MWGFYGDLKKIFFNAFKKTVNKPETGKAQRVPAWGR